MRRLRLALAGLAVAGASVGLTGCHVPADVVCQYFIRDGYRLYAASWNGPAGAYLCTSYVPGTGIVDSYRVYEDPWRRIG